MTSKILILLVSLAVAHAVRYDGFRVVRVVPDSASQVKYLRQLADNNLKLNFWTEPRGVGAAVDIMVSPDMFDSFTATLKTVGFDVTVNMEDVQAIIDLQMAANAERRAGATNFDYNVYHTLAEIEAWIDDVALNYEMAEVFTIGSTYEGRTVRGLKISNSAVPTQKIALFHGCIHAREWVTGSTMLYTVKYLLDQYSTDPDVAKYVDQIDFYIVPILNADGYTFSWTDDRMWRKTRSPNTGSPCMGTDPNRNWDASWGVTPGASALPCSDSYFGSHAFSEQIVSDTSNWILANNPDLYIDFHSYSQMWMSPYGYTEALPADNAIHDQTNAASVNALTAVYGTAYTYGPIATTIYVVTGGSVDWAYDGAGITFAHATELRDTGEFGFLLPEDQIEPTAIETFEAVKATCSILLEN